MDFGGGEGLIGGIISSVFGSSSARQAADSNHDTNISNKKLAYENRKWQEHMSSTAHQREVADLKASGLNPVLSANAGAGTPVGNVATMEPEITPEIAKMQSLDLQKTILEAVSTAQHIKKAKEETRKLSAEADYAQKETQRFQADGVPKGTPFYQSAIYDVFKKAQKIDKNIVRNSFAKFSGVPVGKNSAKKGVK